MDILARNDSLDTFEKENSVLNLVSSGLVAVMESQFFGQPYGFDKAGFGSFRSA